MNWLRELKGKTKINESLKHHTTLSIGGAAKFFIEPKDIDDLRKVVAAARQINLPIFIIGSGSNILVKDMPLECIVISLSLPYFRKISCRGNFLEAGSGVKLNNLLKSAVSHSLSSLEFLVGIPGTVGGALIMNAGAWGENFGNLIEKINLMDYNGNIKILNKKSIKFDYRTSGLRKYIILSTLIKLRKSNKKQIRKTMFNYMHKRFKSQGDLMPNAGCIFKNPSGQSAGRLIELCGLKGKRIGDACVSERHANFILNTGKAKAQDVLGLMALIKQRVEKRFRITLEPEIIIWQ